MRFFRKTFIFHGRASRGEYWWVHLFTILLTAAVGIISGGIGSLMGYSFGNGSDIIDSPLSNLMDNAAIVVELVLWIPNLSLSVRRLHDENRRGWGCGLSGRGSAASARLVDYWWHCVGNGVLAVGYVFTKRVAVAVPLAYSVLDALGFAMLQSASVGGSIIRGALDALNDITKDDAIDFGAAAPAEIVLPQYSLIVFVATLVLNLLMLGSLVTFGSAFRRSVEADARAARAERILGRITREQELAHMIHDSVANDMSAIAIGVSTSNGNITVQYDGIISLVSVLLAFGFLRLMRHRDIFTREFWLGGPHVDSYGEPNQLGRISQYGGGRMQPLWFAVFIVLGIGVQG